jgi:hypothetical protein
MNLKWIVLAIAGLFVISTFLLPYGPIVNNSIEDIDNSNSDNTADVPTWQVSEYWKYSVKYDNFAQTEINLVCYDISNGNYYIGTDSRDQALIHAVYNVNPMLGRQTTTNLDVYENGESKQMYAFPLKDGARWQNTLFERELNVKATHNEHTNGFEITAQDENGFTLEYNYMPEVNWFSEFRIIDETGQIIYELELLDHGYDYEGPTYFMRARDLFDSTSTIIDNPVYEVDNFEVNGHPKYGDFDFLALGITLSDESAQPMSMMISDPTGNIQYRNKIVEESSETSILELPNLNGMWTIRYHQFHESSMNIYVAGVLEYSTIL